MFGLQATSSSFVVGEVFVVNVLRWAMPAASASFVAAVFVEERVRFAGLAPPRSPFLHYAYCSPEGIEFVPYEEIIVCVFIKAACLSSVIGQLVCHIVIFLKQYR